MGGFSNPSRPKAVARTSRKILAMKARIVMRATLHHRAYQHLIRAMAAKICVAIQAAQAGPLPIASPCRERLSTGFQSNQPV